MCSFKQSLIPWVVHNSRWLQWQLMVHLYAHNSLGNASRWKGFFPCWISKVCIVVFFCVFHHFTRPQSNLYLQPISFHFIFCAIYTFHNKLELEMYNSHFGLFLKIHQVRANFLTISKLRDSNLCKAISAFILAFDKSDHIIDWLWS